MPILPFLLRPYILHELPGWGKLFEALDLGGIDNTNPRWRDAPTRTIRGKNHGYLMELDLRDDMMRSTYFLGRYFDHNMQLAIDAAAAPGDTFVDVGANIGMTVLHAASRVGPTGRVIAFEPQPACCERIRRSLTLNAITHVEIINAGLSDAPGRLTLKVLGGGTVMASFAPPADDSVRVREEIACDILVGDRALEGKVRNSLVIKIDVEGFELQCLRGLAGTIERHRPVIFTEITPDFLRRAGTSEDQLFEFMRERRYRALDIRMKRRALRWGLDLVPVREQRDMATMDAVWIPIERSFDPAVFPPEA